MPTLPEEECSPFSNKLNDFYCRFERSDLKESLETIMLDVTASCDRDDLDFNIQF